MISDDSLDLLFIGGLVLLEEIVCIGLSWRIRVGGVQELLNSKENLFDGDGGLPAFLLVQDREADSSGRVDVWVEEWGREFACLGQR